MKRIAALSIVLLFCAALVAPVAAGERTVILQGNIVCAKCKLQEEGRDECQNVLVVQDQGQEKLYYLAKNETYTAYGDVCMKTAPVRVTGTVTQEDGKTWLAAKEITPVEKKG